MPDNEIKVIFTGVDEVTPTIKKIEGGLKGTGGENGGIDDLRSQFEDALKPTEEYTRALEEMEAASVKAGSGLSKFAIGGGIVIGAVAAAAIGIKQLADEVSKLAAESPELFTDQQIGKVQEYDAALGMLKDSFTELKIEIGTAVMPAITDMALGLANSGDIRERVNELVSEGVGRERALAQASRELADETRGVVVANDEIIKQSPEMTAALKAQSAEYKAILSNMFVIQKTSEAFAAGEKSRADELASLEERKIRLAIEMNGVQASGDLTGAKRSEYALKQIEIDNKIIDLQEEGIKAIDDKEKAGQRLIYNMLEQRAAADGLINSQEVQFLQETAVTFGLVDRASADAAITAANTADTMWAGFEKVNDPMSTTLEIMDRIAAYDGWMVNYGVNFQTFGLGALAGMGPRQFGAAATGSANYGATGHGGIDMDWVSQEVGRRQTGRH